MLDESFIIGDEDAPVYPQSLELMKHYVEAFHKVFDNLDQILD